MLVYGLCSSQWEAGTVTANYMMHLEVERARWNLAAVGAMNLKAHPTTTHFPLARPTS